MAVFPIFSTFNFIYIIDMQMDSTARMKMLRRAVPESFSRRTRAVHKMVTIPCKKMLSCGSQTVEKRTQKHVDAFKHVVLYYC